MKKYLIHSDSRVPFARRDGALRGLSLGVKLPLRSLAAFIYRMKNTSCLMSSAAFLLLGNAAAAHHSFAPHFDADKPVSITGTIIEYEQRNPHAYLNIRAEDADGRMEEWRCESHGFTQLSRNGITPDMLKPGTRIGISGSQHRRDPHMCFFDTVYLEDGRELSVNGPRGGNGPQVAQRESIFGTWMLLPGGFATSGPQFMMDYLTDAGKAAVEKYNPFTDDPTYRCEPVAIRRAWGAPGTPLAISHVGDDILIKHEWMDVERTIHMNQASAPADTKPGILGYSVGHFEGDTLVIESTHFTEGVLNQFVTVDGQPMRALLHSDALRVVERISLDRDRNRLVVSMDHFDPVFFSRDFPNYTREYGPSNLNIEPFGCIPEQLK